MKSRRGSDDLCFCSPCLYKRYKAHRGIERKGSKIDRLYRDKYLPLRESKLIDKLERTRAVYDDIRAPFLADYKNSIIANKNVNNIIRDTYRSSDYSYDRESSRRRVRFKPEFIKSEPCVCLAKFSSLVKKQSKFLQSKLKRDFSVPALISNIKEASSKQRSRIGKVFNKESQKINAQAKTLKLTEKVSTSNPHLEKMLKLNVSKVPKSQDKVGEMKQNKNYEGQKYQQELDPRLCPCPQEKLVLKIRKDSIRKFYEDLEKKRTLNHLECKSECIQDICIPKECLDKIKLSKGKKNSKQKKSQKQRKSLKQIVSKASQRKKKKSVMCQCDETTMPTIESYKYPNKVSQNKVKFVTSKKGIRDKSYLKSNTAVLDRPKSETDGNTLKRCFCTLKFKPRGPHDMSQKYSTISKMNYYHPYSEQSGDVKISATQIDKTVKRGVKSKSNCTVYDCDSNECLKNYGNIKRHTANPLIKIDHQRKPGLPESGQDNRRVLRIGSSISFNIELFKENVPKDSHKSIKTNTVPHYLSSKSIKSIRAQKSSKNNTKHASKKKVIIIDNRQKNENINLNENIPRRALKEVKKNAPAKIIATTKYEKLRDTIDEDNLKTEMVDQSTKITNKDRRLLKTSECDPQTCVPHNCDPRLCLEKRNKHNVIASTDLPKMISVASGGHKKKIKHVQAQSKPVFQKRNSPDNEKIQSKVVPTMNSRNTLRLSSNFSFAIEIGRGVVPNINPIENIKRFSSIYKAKNIKSRTNKDIQRKNKSKNSMINTMVKRCMCTLNLSKQRNKNKSINKVNNNFAPNVYAVNTAIVSNIGKFSAKHMPHKKLSHEVQKVSLNEYKRNISNSYAAWHSQIIICNYMNKPQRQNTSKKLLKTLKIQRQLKKKLHLVSKSLSFLSDYKLKKNAYGALCQYAESKNITFYESSDCTSKLYHVGKHQSSKYWEKSYCTMNLRTIYNRNGKTKNLIEKQAQKNCSRFGSKINLNIEFYKNNSCLTPKHYMLPTTIISKGDSFRSKMTQNMITTSNKAGYSVPEDQRCICTLKLQKKSIDKSKQTLPSKKRKLKGLKNISNDISTAEKVMNTTSLVPEEQFFPHECIPGMCVPGRCDPASCYKLLFKRKLKTHSISAATNTAKKVRTGVLTQHSSYKNAKTQSQNIERHKECNEHTRTRTSVPYNNSNNIDSGKKCAKFGSNISFNIEFYKENSPTTKRIHYDPEIYDKKYSKSSKYADASVTTKTQEVSHKKLTARPRDSFIKRCFCTLKLQKKQIKPLLTKVHSIGVMAGVKNRWYSDKLLSNKDNLYNKQLTKGELETKSKNEKQHIAGTALLPYECEPRICIPGACNPYECLEIIKNKKMINRDTVTTSCKKKSLGTSSKCGTSKHRRIQTVSFQQKYNNMDVSRVIPQKVKQKYNSSLTNERCVRIGSNINFSIEFFKDKSCDRTLSRKAIHKYAMKTASTSYKPVVNTKAVTSYAKKTKHTLNKTQEPIVNFQLNSKKQTLSQLSQTRQKYFTKNKGLLPYECKPNVCIPGQCDPYKCYELIQSRFYKDCSAVTVANVRDFATNATPCYTCKSKRIQTGHHHRDGAGIKFKKSVLDHKSRNYIRISSNFGFHIEICKKGESGTLREARVQDDENRYKKVHSRVHDEASQSQYIKKRSQSTFAKSKIQRCFCTKKFFNSSANTANRNFEYTTNYALVPNVIPTINKVNTSRSRGSTHFVCPQFQFDLPKKYDCPTRKVKNNVKPKRLFKLCRNTSNIIDQNGIKSNSSFDLEMYKKNKFGKENLKKIFSDQHILPRQKGNVKKLKGIKATYSKSIQGEGDTRKTVSLKRCSSTINLTKQCQKNLTIKTDSVDSLHETKQAIVAKGYCIKYIPSGANTFHLPQVNIMRRDEENKRCSYNMRFLCNTYSNDHVFSIKNNFIEIKNDNKRNYNVGIVGNKETFCYIRNFYKKLHPFMDKINIKQILKNVKMRRRLDKTAVPTR